MAEAVPAKKKCNFLSSPIGMIAAAKVIGFAELLCGVPVSPTVADRCSAIFPA